MEGAFSCSFTRRDCEHDPIFQNAYQRTNRTRENKILRCFPHCCYGHLPRSYCGASLHLQVDFHVRSSSSVPSSVSPSSAIVRQPDGDDDVLVFACFRPSTNRTLVVGDRVASHTLLSSLQSDANPSGEWIEGRLLASAHQNAWLFELNRSARWYYCWGSSAATTSRNTDHVLEVLVCVRNSPSPSSSLYTAEGNDTLEIVASTCSPPFKLMSFRRSTAAADAAETAAESPPAARSSVLTKRPPPPPPPSPAETNPAPPTPTPHRQPQLRRLLTPLEELTVVVAFAKTLSLTQLKAGLSQLHRQVVDAIGLPPTTHGYPCKVFTQSLGAFPRTTSSSPFPFPSSILQPPQTLVDVAASVVVWLAVDAEIHSTFRRTLERAAANVGNKAWLLQTHTEWLVWLRSCMDQFLHDHHQKTQSLLPAWSVTTLVEEISKCTKPHDQDLAELSFRGFVAQVSQMCVLRQHSTKTSAKSVRPLSPPSTQTSSSSGFPSLPSLAEIQTRHATPPPPPPATWWACVIQDLHIESLDPNPAATTASALTLTLLLWFWRQFACVSIQSSSSTTLSGEQIPCVEIRSAMSSADSGMRLLLDGRPRWAATLPSGDASRGSRLLDDLSVGDYVATMDETTGELTIQWFAWQATPSASGTVWTAAWSLCLRLAVVNTTEMLAVATVERGSLDASSRPFDESMNATQRLHHIRAWTPQWKLAWSYLKM